MNFWKGKVATIDTRLSLKVQRAPDDGTGHPPVWIEIDGYRFEVSAGDFSKTLGASTIVGATFKGKA